MRPDELPEELLRVNGFRRVKGHESYVEWRRTDGRRTANVWASFGERGPPVVDVLYEVKESGRLVDQGAIAEVGGRRSGRRDMWEDAVEHAVAWMRAYGEGANGAGDVPAVPDELDFT
jgi:hypothetical protein